MFNRIRHTVSRTDERCVLMSRRHRSPMPIGPPRRLAIPLPTTGSRRRRPSDAPSSASSGDPPEGCALPVEFLPDRYAL